jgi:hypothetical protein
VHLPVDPEQRTIGVDDRRGVVIEPLARFSNSDAITTTPRFFASLQNASVLGPGIGSARSKFAWSSF